MLGYVTTNYYDVRCNCKPFVSNRATSVKDGSHFCLPAERSMTLSASVTTNRSRALIGPRCPRSPFFAFNFASFL